MRWVRVQTSSSQQIIMYFIFFSSSSPHPFHLHLHQSISISIFASLREQKINRHALFFPNFGSHMVHSKMQGKFRVKSRRNLFCAQWTPKVTYIIHHLCGSPLIPTPIELKSSKNCTLVKSIGALKDQMHIVKWKQIVTKFERGLICSNLSISVHHVLGKNCFEKLVQL